MILGWFRCVGGGAKCCERWVPSAGVSLASTLTHLAGFPMPVDVLSVTQGDNRVFSFMTQAIGLMSEVDLGTEHLRFMGDTYV